ncbi:hypothetical protein SCL_1331 [Sulfuricaulis limicola]|uniref:Uncharacterized protein n=1 Tax=Sulfuricaulis limicola TaxID=1620215 RepID=A0A1B4XFQ8_9GAMM|nr:hypothetical protein [Sulfuricaulis limicola]BAV33642.1 hypothetical protein SCL_1331 [Sulfuricaulis limicola]
MKHIKVATIGAAFSLALLASPSVFAGPYSDEMAKCLVTSTSEADKNFLVKWIFAAASLHPAVKSISSISDSQRNELNVKIAKLFERLLTESCKAQTQQAVKYEGPGTIEAAFQVLGQVAGRGLFSDPGVAGYVAQLGKHVDPKKMESVLGVPKKPN